MTIVRCLLCAGVLALLAVAPAPAQAQRTLLSDHAVHTTFCRNCPEPPEVEVLDPTPPEEGQIEGPCGLAIDGGSLYLADYYHRVVDVFSLAGGLQNQFSLPGENPAFGVNSLNAACGLAIDSGGNLYANEWHESVVRLDPTPTQTFTVQTFDSEESTGVAVDSADRVYVNDRTYVAVYEPSGAPVLSGGLPLRIGLGSLGDAYGLAVSDGRVYVPDAADDTVKVYEPAVDEDDPVATIAGPEPDGFVSLLDATVAIDPTTDHLLVVDNLQPLYKSPISAVYEFSATGEFLDRLAGQPIHGEPSGLAVDPASGTVFVTDGNSELSNVFSYGPYEASGFVAPGGALPGGGETELPPPGGSAVQTGSTPVASLARRARGSAEAVVVQKGGVRVRFDGKLTPQTLPRHGTAPVGIAVDARISGAGAGAPPQLRRLAIEVNRNGRFRPHGLPVCRTDDIQPSTTGGALAACGGALVGEGHFSANIKLPEQSPFPSEGKVLAFNGMLRGRPAILAHIYGTQPAPTSYVLPFSIAGSRGTYGTVLEASLPDATGNWGYVTGLRMSLRRRFSAGGKGHSYLSAGCPAPPGFPSAVFPLARTRFSFAGGTTLVSVLNRSCKARG